MVACVRPCMAHDNLDMACGLLVVVVDWRRGCWCGWHAECYVYALCLSVGERETQRQSISVRGQLQHVYCVCTIRECQVGHVHTCVWAWQVCSVCCVLHVSRGCSELPLVL